MSVDCDQAIFSQASPLIAWLHDRLREHELVAKRLSIERAPISTRL
jgi:hypothetical protein